MNRHFLFSFILFFCMGMTCSTYGQESPQASNKLSETQKEAVIRSLIKRIDDFYVIEDDAAEIAQAILTRHEEQAYQNLNDPQQFASQLTIDLRAASNDVHFAVIVNPTTFQFMEWELQALDGPDSRETMRKWLEADAEVPDLGNLGGGARQNYFFSRLEVLEGNVGYLRLDRMPELEPAKPTLNAAMAFLVHSDAVIIDVRGNPGGVGGFIPYLMSYFFPAEKTLLYKREYPAVNVTDEYFTAESIAGKRLDQIPLYVLIDLATGSAARNLGYTLQSFERGTLVGEASGEQGPRGAHSGGLFPLADDLLVILPFARVVNARTHANWRDSGVQPDVPTSSEEALFVAHQLALEALLQGTEDEEIIQELNMALENLEHSANSSTAQPETNEALAEYTGTYGERTIALKGGSLTYTRQGMGAQLEMREIEKDLYKLVLPANAVSGGQPPDVRFNRDEQGVIVSFSLIGPDGAVLDTTQNKP